MTVDESVENLKITVEAFERLRVGLCPFVEDTVTEKFPKLVEGDREHREQLWKLCHHNRERRANESLYEGAKAFKHMDISAILNLMANGQPVMPEGKSSWLEEFSKELGVCPNDFKPVDLIIKRNNVAHHHNGKSNRLRGDLQEVLETACTWLRDIADRYDEAKEQLEKLEALQSKVGHPLKPRRQVQLSSKAKPRGNPNSNQDRRGKSQRYHTVSNRMRIR